jgi:hypothetical protein
MQASADKTLYDDFTNSSFPKWTNVTGFMGRNYAPDRGVYTAQGQVGNDSTYVCMEDDFGLQVDRVELYYKETSSSHGGAYRLLDNNDNVVCVAGTSNPQAIWSTGNSGKQKSWSPGYGEWIKLTFAINPENDNFEVQWNEQGTNNSVFKEGGLTTNAYPEKIQFLNVKNEAQLFDSSTSSSYYQQTGSVEYRGILGSPSNVSATASSNDVSLSWDTASGASGYNILRAPSSGGSYSQIASVGSGTTPFADSGLAYGENYAYKIESYN